MGNVQYAFLIDECVLGCAKFFPTQRAITAADADLIGAPDDAVVAKADDLRCIVVTNDNRDYREEFRRYAEAGGKRVCTDLFGLVVIPNDAIAWRHVFPIKKLEQRLRLRGRKIGWRDVFDRNLYVRVEAMGKVAVDELPRCPICRNNTDSQ